MNGNTAKTSTMPLSLLIKPASADCNLHCSYCFYLEKAALYPHTAKHRMGKSVLEPIVEKYLKTQQPAYSFGWQGGEPLLMGVDFFRQVTELQEKYARKGARITNAVQTNGLLLSSDFAKHFASCHFLVGISIDGPEDVHNIFRTSKGGKGSHKQVLEGLEVLKTYRVEHNALVLVSKANVKMGSKIYSYLKDDLGINYHQYIPCVEFDGEGKPLPYTITPEEWGMFLLEIFDRWMSGDVGRISVRLFDAILQLLVTGRHVLCTQSPNCNLYMVVEYSGDVYPCDFFVEKEQRLGNIRKNSWNELISKKSYVDFGKLKSEYNGECVRCGYLPFCHGDCLKNRPKIDDYPQSLSWLCNGWKLFYSRTIPVFKRIAYYIVQTRKYPPSRLHT